MKDINLFDGIKKSAPPKKKGKSAAGGLAVLIACAVLVGGIYYWLSTQKDATQSEIDAANRQIGAAQATTDDSGLEAKQSRLAALRSYNAMLSALDENVQAYPKLDAAFLGDLERRMPAGVTVLSLVYQGGVLTLDCAAENADAPANFADALTQSEYIDAAALKGSSLDVEAQAESGAVRFNFTVECYLKGGDAQ